MHVLVVGGTRFVGLGLTWRLLAAGHRVTLFNRGTRPDPFGARVERLRGDRTTGALAEALGGRRFDATVDFAAYVPRDVEEVLALGERLGHYVFVSTGQVYLVREGLAPPFREADYDGPVMPAPADPDDRREWDYGVGKRGCEDLLAAATFPVTRLRIPMVMGERDPFHRLEAYLWRILDGGAVLLPDGGGQRTRHVYAGEVARAIVALLRRPDAAGKAWNVCQEETPTLAELVGMVARMVGAPDRTLAVSTEAIARAGLETRQVSPLSSRWASMLDPFRAQTELGFLHEPLERYLGKIVASFLAHAPGEPPEGYAGRDRELELASRADRVTRRIKTEKPVEP